MPMMMAQPYSFVLAKVKDGVNVEEVAKKMNENIDERKWICVLPEKVYTTTSGDVICLVMAREEVGKPVYEKFKTLAGTTGEEYVRTVEDGQLPDRLRSRSLTLNQKPTAIRPSVFACICKMFMLYCR